MDTPTPTSEHQVSQPQAVPTLPGLLNGLTYQTPVIGTIRIGGIEEKDGQRLPFTDDKFSIHTRYRNSTHEWVPHAAQEPLQKDPKNLTSDGRLASIPVRIIYDNPNLNMGEQFSAFRQDGRPACVGNGLKAKRVVNGQVQSVQCAGPAACDFAAQSEHRCEAFARALFHIEGQEASEGAFIFRTGSYNSVNDMRVRLQSLHAGFGGKLSGLPMRLQLRLKSTAQSNNEPFYYASLEPNFANFKEAMAAIKEREQEESACGFNRAAFEASLVQLLANGAFSENVEDAGEYEEMIAARPSLPPRTTGSSNVSQPANPAPASQLEDLSNFYGAATNASTNQSPPVGAKAA